jgi:hypothetical protein
MEMPGARALGMMEHVDDVVMRLPVVMAVYRMQQLEEGASVPKMDRVGDDGDGGGG